MSDLKEEAKQKFEFLSPSDLSNCQITIPASTPYRVKHIFRKTKGILIVVTFSLVDNICYNFDLEFPSLEDARAAGWAV